MPPKKTRWQKVSLDALAPTGDDSPAPSSPFSTPRRAWPSTPQDLTPIPTPALLAVQDSLTPPLNPTAAVFQFKTNPTPSSEFPSLGGGAQQAPAGQWGATRQRSPTQGARQPYGRGMGRTQDEPSRADAVPPGADGYQFGPGRTNQTANRGSARSPNPFSSQEQEPIGYTGRSEQPAPGLTNDGPSSPPAISQQTSNSPSAPGQRRLADMTDRERFGIPGLIARMTPNGPDYDPLTMGFDLTKLGINMDSNEPLINTWAGPFDDTNFVVPDFQVPAAYTVTNVPPLASKMESFSDETLIMIFYQYPRDIHQELAAQALYKRDWRWHIKMRCWMMKDSNNQHLSGYGQGPVRIDEKRERGMYILFDVNNWRRERKDLVLNFDDLDTRVSLMQGTALAGANGQGPAQQQQQNVGVGTPALGTNGLGAGGFGGVVGGGFGGAAFGGVGSA